MSSPILMMNGALSVSTGIAYVNANIPQNTEVMSCLVLACSSALLICSVRIRGNLSAKENQYSTEIC